LFHGLLLSAAAASSRSIRVIDQFGSSRRSNAPSVALMIPAPTSTTSVCAVAAGSDTPIACPSFDCAGPGYPECAGTTTCARPPPAKALTTL
jgi:hypothetical protein